MVFFSDSPRFSFNPIQPQVKMLSYGMTEQDKSVIPGQDDEDKEEESEQEEDGGEEEESGSGEDDDEDEFSDLASSEDGDNDAETGDQEPKIKTKKKTATPSKTAKNDEIPFVFKSKLYPIRSLLPSSFTLINYVFLSQFRKSMKNLNKWFSRMVKLISEPFWSECSNQITRPSTVQTSQRSRECLHF